MSTVYIGLGSNVGDAPMRIEEAVRRLASHGIEIVARSGCYMVSMPYYNMVLRVKTALDCAAISALAKSIELEMGRTPVQRRLGRVPIDIDVVLFDGRLIRPSDFAADYFSRGYAAINQ